MHETDERYSPLPGMHDIVACGTRPHLIVIPLANIYFPAIPTLTGVFHKSTSSLNLTVTVYLILQGICVSSSPHTTAIPLTPPSSHDMGSRI